MNYTHDEIVRLIRDGYSFSGESCSCGLTINTLHTEGFTCSCGHYTFLTLQFHKPHDNPDNGPSAMEIRAARKDI
jgi:hypothetical protein